MIPSSLSAAGSLPVSMREFKNIKKEIALESKSCDCSNATKLSSRVSSNTLSRMQGSLTNSIGEADVIDGSTGAFL